MTVNIPSPLRSYTGNRASVEAEGATLAELLLDLDHRYPGIRFRMIDEQNRIRRHIKLFVDEQMRETLDASVTGAREVHIIAALSGGAGAPFSGT